MTNTITFEQALAQVGTKQDALVHLKEIYVNGEFKEDYDWTFEQFLECMDDMCEDYSQIVTVAWHVATGKTNKWVEWAKEDGVED